MKKLIQKVLLEYKEKLDIDDEIHIRLRSYKTKAASVNIKKNIITINKDVFDLGEDVIRYLILHELIHLKLKSLYHDITFKELLRKNLYHLDLNSIRAKILYKLFKLNNTKNKFSIYNDGR